MPHSYASNRLHIVFSTHQREKQIPRGLQARLWGYMAGVARKHELVVHEIGGVEDHAHIFLSVPPTLPVSKAVQTIKANSSRWVKENGVKNFAWQEGFGAFSVSASNAQWFATSSIRKSIIAS